MFYFKRTLGFLAGTGMVCTLSVPAYGIAYQPEYQVEVQEFKTDSLEKSTQTLRNHSNIQVSALRDNVVITEVAQASSASAYSAPVFDASSIPSNQGLLGAAFAQVGVYLDCTAMVENALRAIGYSVPDLGPMEFSQYGVQIDPSQAQAGDIMMRPGHVAIYAGNGMAVQGGFGFGGVVFTDIDADPYGYSIIVRV